jgi:hypothetical protein
MGCVEGSGVPVLYIGRRVPKGWSTDSKRTANLCQGICGYISLIAI